MSTHGTLGDFCRYVLEYEDGRYASDPVRLGALFREYAGIDRTPAINDVVGMVSSLGLKIKAVTYLDTGGTNMTANGCWHIHYAAKDRPATQKFDIFHELFEVIHKNLNSLNLDYGLLKEPYISQYADRFAASTLIPPDFFLNQAGIAGCDVVKLGEDLELSHQCLLIALGQHFVEIPFIGALYEYRPDIVRRSDDEIKDFMATVVVKSPRARRIKRLCGLQTVPVRNSHPKNGSLVCAAVTGGRPVLWRSTRLADSPAILVRPLLSAVRDPYRVIFLAIPNEEFGMISSQVESIEPVPVNGDVTCPSEQKCQVHNNCIWRSTGGYNGRRI